MKKLYIQLLFLFLGLISLNTFAQISGPTQGCSSSPTLGTYTAPAGSTFSWSVTSGPGGAFANTPSTQTTSITFPGAGTYLVECLVNGGSNYTYNVTINQSPTAVISGPNQVCTGAIGNFTGNFVAGVGYAWSVDGGGSLTTPSSQNCDFNATTAGSYNITLVLTDIASGCIGGMTLPVTVDLTPTATILSGPSVACDQSQQSYGANNTTGCSYLWNINTPANLFGSTTQYCDVNFAGAGNSTLTLYVQNTTTNCFATATKLITVNQTPIANYPSVTMCNGDTVTVTADFVAGATYYWSAIVSQTIGAVTNQSVTIAYTSGNNLGLTLTGSNGCLGNYSHVVTVNNRPNATLTTDHPNLCEGGTASIYPAGSAATYSWFPTTGLDNPTAPTVNANPTVTTMYHVTMTDVNGCTSTDSILQPVIAKDSIQITSTDNFNCTGYNGHAEVAVFMPAYPPYIYSWSNGATTDTIINLSAAAYTATVTNAYGCSTVKATTVSNVFISPAIDNSAVTIANSTCGLSNGSFSGLIVTSGTPPYNYAWSDSVNYTLDIANVLAGSYDITVTDANNCANSYNAVIGNNNNSSISGNITTLSSPISGNSEVTIFRLNGGGALTQSITQTSTNGSFLFTGLPAFNYVIAVTADSTTYPNAIKTYFGNTNLWIHADTLSPTCLSPITNANIDVIQTPALSGSANISGVILNNTIGKTTVQGDPIPGVDVALEQNPGSVMSVTTTNNSGSYSFVNIPTGNFIITVDVPGLPQVSTYNVTVTGNNSIVNQNFYVDSAGVIDTIRPIILKTQQVFNSAKVDFIAYPNPFSDNITLQYNVAEESKVSISVVNILGETVFNTARVNKQAGNYYYNLNTKDTNMQAGIYFVRLEINGKINTYKIVKRD